MKRILILTVLLIWFVKADILVIMNNRNTYPGIIKKMTSLFKNEKIVIAPVNKFQRVNISPRLIFCFERNAVGKFSNNLSDVPVILFYVKDPLIPVSLNMTGVMYTSPPSIIFSLMNAIELSGKKVVTIIPEGETENSYIENAKRASQRYGILLKVIEVKQGSIFEVSEEIKSGDLIWIFPNKITLSPGFTRYIIRFSLSEKKPLIGYSRSMVEQGFVLAVEVNEKVYEDKVYKLLKSIKEGRNPLAIPLQYPDVFNYYYNFKVAKLLNFELDFSKFYKEVEYIAK